MDDDMQEGGDPAEAFDRLRAIVEGQDRELALLRRAVEGLAAERAHIDVPDYSETLGRMQQSVDATADRIAVINDVIAHSPALAMTPEQMAQRIAAAGNTARREDQAALAKAGEDKAVSWRSCAPSLVRHGTGTIRKTGSYGSGWAGWRSESLRGRSCRTSSRAKSHRQAGSGPSAWRRGRCICQCGMRGGVC